MKYINQEEIDAILGIAIFRVESRYRDYCLMRLITNYGMRIIDLINLKVSDVDLESGIISLRCKGGLIRTVMLINQDLIVLRGLVSLYRDIDNSSWLFRSCHGKKLTNRQMIKMVRNLTTKANLQVKTKDLIATYIAKRIDEEGIDKVKDDLGYSTKNCKRPIRQWIQKERKLISQVSLC